MLTVELRNVVDASFDARTCIARITLQSAGVDMSHIGALLREADLSEAGVSEALQGIERALVVDGLRQRLVY